MRREKPGDEALNSFHRSLGVCRDSCCRIEADFRLCAVVTQAERGWLLDAPAKSLVYETEQALEMIDQRLGARRVVRSPDALRAGDRDAGVGEFDEALEQYDVVRETRKEGATLLVVEARVSRHSRRRIGSRHEITRRSPDLVSVLAFSNFALDLPNFRLSALQSAAGLVGYR
ncbi:MAG: hypothetical protein OSB60_00730 [Myxococcota bacterium]|nr:hypothetical protein [Myxococcota bacterium]